MQDSVWLPAGLALHTVRVQVLGATREKKMLGSQCEGGRCWQEQEFSGRPSYKLVLKCTGLLNNKGNQKTLKKKKTSTDKGIMT